MTIATVRHDANLFAAGVQSDVEATYRQTYDNVLEGLADIMTLGRPTTTRTTKLGYRETMPYPRRRVTGEPVQFEGVDAVHYSITAYEYASGVSWQRNDRLDVQLSTDILSDANMVGEHFAVLPSDIAFELMTGSATLLPAVPNAPDGAAVYSATAGSGAARFGVSGGNLYTGTGTTAAQITADFYGAIERMSTFQNTKGKAFFRPNVRGVKFVIYHGAGLQQQFAEAFRAEIVQGSSAGVSNVILANQMQVELRPTASISDNDWYVFRTDVPVKPFTQLVLEPLRFIGFATESNSDEARTTGVESVSWEWRGAFSPNLPIGTIKINN